MKHRIWMKGIAIILTALSLTAAIVGALGIVMVAESGLYTQSVGQWKQARLESRASYIAESAAQRYVVRNLTNCSDAILEQLGYWYVFTEESGEFGMHANSYGYVLKNPDGKILMESLPTDAQLDFSLDIPVSTSYPVLVSDTALIDQLFGKHYLHTDRLYATVDGQEQLLTLRYYESPEYTVTVQLDTAAHTGVSVNVIQQLYDHRYDFIKLLVVALVVFGFGVVYLCCAAGKTHSGAQSKPEGLNRLPLDLYAAGVALAGVGACALVLYMAEYWLFYDGEISLGILTLLLLVTLAVCLMLTGFIFAFAAQIKTRRFYWWQHSLIGWLCGKLLGGLCKLWRGLCRVWGLLPLIWHHLLIGTALGIGLVFSMLLAVYEDMPLALFLMIGIGIVCVLYSGYATGILYKGAEKMAKGDLENKIDTQHLIGAYAQNAAHLNALADVATVAARNQLKSDRMKTELITNVSHDIKTPLTSIINYVDLLQKTEDATQRKEYLQVLERQSQRIKKLIEDLVEMSKATTGNMNVEITQVDAVEAVTQALGEFSDKLKSRELSIVFRQPETPLPIRADGRLIWRVLSNLLSNVYKYALPGTRVYVDVIQVDRQVLISIKNISREELNVSANELTERFVRGDASRNTEGSGLGLNIAQSLMELQKGKLQLLVDGDLFKVTLFFPADNG